MKKASQLLQLMSQSDDYLRSTSINTDLSSSPVFVQGGMEHLEGVAVAHTEMKVTVEKCEFRFVL